MYVPSFNTMDPERIRELLEAKTEDGQKLYPDVLTPLARQETALFQRTPCPKCGSSSTAATLNTHRPFAPTSPLPNMIARCVVCQTEFDPKTGIITLATLIDGSA